MKARCDEFAMNRKNVLRRKVGDGVKPAPSEPQSADTGCQASPHVAESAYLRRFDCSRSPSVSACCVLGGVSGGVIRYRQPLPLSALSHRVPPRARRPCSVSSPHLTITPAPPREKTLYSTLPQAVHTLLFGARPKSSELGRKYPLRDWVNNQNCECSSTFHLGTRVRAGWLWNPPRRPTPPSSPSRA